MIDLSVVHKQSLWTWQATPIVLLFSPCFIWTGLWPFSTTVVSWSKLLVWSFFILHKKAYLTVEQHDIIPVHLYNNSYVNDPYHPAILNLSSIESLVDSPPSFPCRSTRRSVIISTLFGVSGFRSSGLFVYLMAFFFVCLDYSVHD